MKEGIIVLNEWMLKYNILKEWHNVTKPLKHCLKFTFTALDFRKISHSRHIVSKNQPNNNKILAHTQNFAM